MLSRDTKSRDVPQGMKSPGLRVTTAHAEPSPTWYIQQHPSQGRLGMARGIPETLIILSKGEVIRQVENPGPQKTGHLTTQVQAQLGDWAQPHQQIISNLG